MKGEKKLLFVECLLSARAVWGGSEESEAEWFVNCQFQRQKMAELYSEPNSKFKSFSFPSSPWCIRRTYCFKERAGE